MPLDLQIAYPQQIVNLNSVRLVQNFLPPLLEVRAEVFTSVDAVYINDLESPNFVIVDTCTLLAEIPKSVIKQDISSVKVLTNEPSYTDANVIKFRIGNVPSTVQGINRLAQLFMKLLLQTPGTDIFNKQLGGGLLKFVGRTVGGQGGQIVADFTMAVERVTRQILALQARKKLPPDEKLLSAKVTSARYDREQSSLIVTVFLTSQAGNSIPVNVVS